MILGLGVVLLAFGLLGIGFASKDVETNPEGARAMWASVGIAVLGTFFIVQGA